MIPSANPSPQPKRHIGQFSHFCRDHGRVSLYFTTNRPSPLKLPLPVGSGPHLTHDSLGPFEPNNSNGILIGSAVFAQMTSCPYTLQWHATFSPQNCPFPWGIWSPSNTWFPGPTPVLNVNGISIGSAVFARLTSVTDRQTDRQTDHSTLSVTIGRTRGLITHLR